MNRATQTGDDKRLLLIAYDYPPEKTAGVYRTTAMTRQLVRRGWQLTVVTVRNPEVLRPFDDSDLIPKATTVVRTWRGFHYWRFKRRMRRAVRGSASRRYDNGTDVGAAAETSSAAEKGEGMKKRFERLLTFPDARIGWFVPLLFTAGAELARGRYPVVLSSSPPHSSHLPILLLRLLFRFRWIVDFRDPWTSPARGLKGRWNVAVQRRLERWVLSASDVILANTPGNARALKRDFARETRDKVHLMTNGFDPSLFAPEEAEHAREADCDLVYVGHMYPEMFTEYLGILDAIRTGGHRIPRLQVYGTPPSHSVIRDCSAGDYTPYITFREEVSYRDSISLMQRAPALLVLLPRFSTSSSWVPSKIYAYMNSGRPLVAIMPDGDAATILEQAGAGCVIRDPDPKVIAERMLSYLADVALRKAQPVKRASIEQYSWDVMGQRLDTLLCEQLEGRVLGGSSEREFS